MHFFRDEHANGVRRLSVVDDDQSVRKAIEWLGNSAGYRVESYDSAEAFLDARRTFATDCLILDFQLPGRCGEDLVADILASHRQIPVIVITHDVDEHSRDLALENGAFAYLRKPVECGRLLDVIQQAIDQDGLM